MLPPRFGARATAAGGALAARLARRLRDPLAWLRPTPADGRFDPDRDRLPIGATVFWIVTYVAIVAFVARG